MSRVTWRAAQKTLCDCVPYELLEKRHREALAYFYAKYAPDSADKIDGLMVKYATKGNAKYALLMLGLHQKYRQAVNVTLLTKDQMEQQDAFGQDLERKLGETTDKFGPAKEKKAKAKVQAGAEAADTAKAKRELEEAVQKAEKKTKEQDPGEQVGLYDPPKPVPTWAEL